MPLNEEDNKNEYKKILTDADTILFCIFLVVIVILTPFVMDMVSRSWKTELMGQIKEAIESIDSSSISIFISVTIGFYVGSLLLLGLDKYKKVQAVIISIGLILTIKYLIDNYATDWNIYAFLIGAGVGIALGSINNSKPKGDYERAAKNIVMVSTGYLVITYIILYASLNVESGKFLIDSGSVLGFSALMTNLLLYKGKGPRVFVIGPAKSGKTVFLVGCYIQLVKLSQDQPINPSKSLYNAYNELKGSTKTQSEIEAQHLAERNLVDPKINPSWIERTEDTVEYSFTYVIGKLFPKEVTVRSVDFPGSYIVNIPDYMFAKRTIEKGEEEYVKTAKYVEESDKLILVIDSNNFPNYSEEIGQYIAVARQMRENRKNVKYYIVITKSDIFIDDFKKNKGYEQFYSFGNKDYDNFRSFMTEKFSKNGDIMTLLPEIYGAPMYPVFYETEKYHGARLPLINDNGNVYVCGFSEFMKDLFE
ncbi:MAG: hypothetical protein C3F06_10585 [Candidatus Methanoperedenaceae archaeon]|nr:MAG: hypothetical protein C3F06_10585 [Candidatus Methanoperedenaceae archaeon]